jgi:hypothetical protein
MGIDFLDLLFLTLVFGYGIILLVDYLGVLGVH